MKTFVITVIYAHADPFCYELQADSRSEALRLAWDKHEQVADHIKKISAVRK